MREVHRIAQVFLVRGERILVLQRGSGRGAGWWSPPGGNVEPGEEAGAAAVRETFEETGLRIADVRLLREWSFQLAGDAYERRISSYAVAAPAGAVVLSDEHTAHQWILLNEYAERYCGEQLELAAPDYAPMFREMREDCTLLRNLIEDESGWGST